MARPPVVLNRRRELDAVRGVAILAVMGSHFDFPITGIVALDGTAYWLHAIGPSGVNLFFALSGFLVGGLLFAEYRDTGRIRPVRFLTRRAFKIWPPLYAFVLFQAVVRRHPPETFVWQNLLHVPNYAHSSLTQTWSLGVEEHFYVMLAVLLWAVAGRGSRVLFATLGAIAAASVIARLAALAAGDSYGAFAYTHLRLDSLLVGVGLAALFHLHRAQFDAHAPQRGLLLAATVTTGAWMVWSVNGPTVARWGNLLVQGVGFTLAITLVYAHSGALVRQWWYRGLAAIGVYSYGIYLWHTIFRAPGILLSDRLAAHGVPIAVVWVLTTLATFGAAIVTGAVMTKLVEWRALRLRERLAPRSDPCGVPAPPLALAPESH